MTTITTPPIHLWLEQVEVVRQQRPELLKRYLDSYGLSELPEPRWVDPENATVFYRTKANEVDSFRLRMTDYSGGALVALMERGLSLAPLEPLTPVPEVETPIETETDPPKRTDQAESQTDKRFSFDLTWSDGKACRRKYKREGDLKNHRKKHDGETK